MIDSIVRRTPKDWIKLFLERRGLYVKRYRSVPYGADLWSDLRRLGLRNAPDTVVFDVGANRGSWTRELLLRFPKVCVHAFEPVPSTFADLRKALGGHPRIRLNQAALSDTAGEAEIRLYDLHGLSSLEPGRESGPRLRETVRVALELLSNYIREHAIERIDLLKTDTEGHDTKVVSGLGDMLKRGVVDMILSEVEFHDVKHPHTKFFDLYALLTNSNYRIVTIYTEYVDRDQGFGYGSALFKRAGKPGSPVCVLRGEEDRIQPPHRGSV